MIMFLVITVKKISVSKRSIDRSQTVATPDIHFKRKTYSTWNIIPTVRKWNWQLSPSLDKNPIRKCDIFTHIMQLRCFPATAKAAEDVRKLVTLCKFLSHKTDRLKKHRVDAALICSHVFYGYLKGLLTWIMHRSYFYMKCAQKLQMNNSMMAQISKNQIYKIDRV